MQTLGNLVGYRETLLRWRSINVIDNGNLLLSNLCIEGTHSTENTGTTFVSQQSRSCSGMTTCTRHFHPTRNKDMVKIGMRFIIVKVWPHSPVVQKVFSIAHNAENYPNAMNELVPVQKEKYHLPLSAACRRHRHLS